MRLAYLLVLAALAGAGCAPQPQSGANPPKKPEPIDVAVIDAAMLSFFDKTEWNAGEWTSGDFVVVRPEWAENARPSFDAELDSAIEWSSTSKAGAPDVTKLKGIKGAIQREGTAFVAGKLQPIKELQFDERIVVSDVERTFGPLDDIKVESRSGKVGRVRAMGRVSPPAYSRDGRYAYVSMTGVPWSIHHVDLTFFLDREDKGWKVVHVQTVYFL